MQNLSRPWQLTTQNREVTEAVQQVAKDYGVNLLQGVLSHQLKRYVIDGNKVIIQREEHDQKVTDATFEANEVYAVDIALCTGDDSEAKVIGARVVSLNFIDLHTTPNKHFRIYCAGSSE